MYNHKKHLSIATLLVIASTFVVYLLQVQMFDNVLMGNASAEGAKTEVMFNVHWWIIAFLFSLIVVFMVYSIFVFRRKEGDDTPGEYMHGNTAVEIAWTVAPIGLVIAMAIWGSNMLIDITRAAPVVDADGERTGLWMINSSEEDEAIDVWEVKVRGFKWGWAFTYEDGTELASLVVPKDVTVVLEMESDDILHSFWIPEFSVKQDLLPGAVKQLRFTPIMDTQEMVRAQEQRTGIPGYRVQVRCAEICGTRHAYMYANVFSVNGGVSGAMAEVERIANDIPELPADRGEFWYVNYGCNACHSNDGEQEGYTGPTWKDIYLKEGQFEDGTTYIADDEYLRNSILNPNSDIVAGYAAGVMPQNFGEQFEAKEAEMAESGRPNIDTIADIIEYMKVLSE